ncbi:hypothetical protein D3C72_2188550 [compost metagenome]
MQRVEIEADEFGRVLAVMGLQPIGGGGEDGADAIAFLDEMAAPERGDREDDLAALDEGGCKLAFSRRCRCHIVSLAKQTEGRHGSRRAAGSGFPCFYLTIA